MPYHENISLNPADYDDSYNVVNMNRRSYNQPSKKSGSVLQQICGRRYYAFGHIRKCSLIIERLIGYNLNIFTQEQTQYFSDAELERLNIIKSELDNLFQKRHTRYLKIQ